SRPGRLCHSLSASKVSLRTKRMSRRGAWYSAMGTPQSVCRLNRVDWADCRPRTFQTIASCCDFHAYFSHILAEWCRGLRNGADGLCGGAQGASPFSELAPAIPGARVRPSLDAHGSEKGETPYTPIDWCS